MNYELTDPESLPKKVRMGGLLTYRHERKDNSMRQWFYSAHGEQMGPVPEDIFIQMFQSGQLRSDTLVWADGLKDWTPAGKVEHLFPQGWMPPLSSMGETFSTSQPIFLHIPVVRLVFMSIISLGLYEAYWIYKNWRYLKERDGLKIRPFWRGILGVFFCYGLLRSIRNDRQTNALEQATFSAGGLAAGWIICVLLGNALVFIAMLSFIFFIPVQSYINRVNAKLYQRPEFTQWSLGHTVCLVLGIVIWVLVLTT